MLDEIGELGWPVFVKPAAGRVIDRDLAGRPGRTSLRPAIEEARRYDREGARRGGDRRVEVECAVLEGIDGGPTEASVPGQIVVDPHSTWYDFEAKYLGAESPDGDSRADARRRPSGSVSPGVRRLRRDLVRGTRPGGLLLHCEPGMS